MDVALDYLANKKVIRGLQAGTFYQHEESYLAQQSYWRGVHMLHEVSAGNYSHSEISLAFLRRRYL